MSQILVSMSLYLVITVVNSSNTATDISGHSKQAQESQVNVIPSYKLKHSGPRASEDGALHNASRHWAGELRDTPWTGAGRGLG